MQASPAREALFAAHAPGTTCSPRRHPALLFRSRLSVDRLSRGGVVHVCLPTPAPGSHSPLLLPAPRGGRHPRRSDAVPNRRGRMIRRRGARGRLASTRAPRGRILACPCWSARLYESRRLFLIPPERRSQNKGGGELGARLCDRRPRLTSAHAALPAASQCASTASMLTQRVPLSGTQF